MYRSAILIQGFDIDFGEVWLTFLTKRIESIFVIGDGQSSVDGGELVDSLRNVSQLSTCANQNERILIIIHAHGDIDPGDNHTVRLAKEFPMYSQVLFRLINVYFKGSVDLIFASCHGGGALKDIGELAQGNRVLILSGKEQITLGIELENLMKEKYPNDIILSLDSFYEHYLFHLTSKTAPIIAEVGGNMIDPYIASQKYLGKQLNSLAKEYVLNKFSTICDKVEECHKETDVIFNKIERLNSHEDLFPQQKAYYMKALGDILEYSQFINATVLEQFNILKQSPIFFNQIKVNIDSIFEQHKIPLSIDLNKMILADLLEEGDWGVLDTFYKFENQITDYSLYQSFRLLNGSIQPNNHFPPPEKSDYGSVLLIVKYLDEYCSQHDCLVS